MFLCSLQRSPALGGFSAPLGVWGTRAHRAPKRSRVPRAAPRCPEGGEPGRGGGHVRFGALGIEELGSDRSQCQPALGNAPRELVGFGAGGLRIPVRIRVHAELLWLLPAFFLFLSHPFLYATFANLPVFLLFLFFFFPFSPHPSQPLPPLSPFFPSGSCSLFVLARAALQLPHIWRERAAANPLPVCF